MLHTIGGMELVLFEGGGGSRTAARRTGMAQKTEEQNQKPSRAGSKALDVSNEMAARDVREAVRIKHNQLFALFNSRGEVPGDERGFGLFFRDMCFLSRSELRIAGSPVIALAAESASGNVARFELTNGPLTSRNSGASLPQGRLSIRRTIELTESMRDEISIRSMVDQAIEIDLTVTIESSFQDSLSDPWFEGTETRASQSSALEGRGTRAAV